MRHLILFLVLVLASGPALAGKGFTLSADPALVESGLMRFLLPRFSLKTGIRPELVAAPGAAADAFLDATGGTPAIRGPARLFYIRVNDPASPAGALAQRFADWLTSETGRRTIAQFRAPDGSQPYAPPPAEVEKAANVTFDGDAARGEIVARQNCARCHAIGSRDSMNSIGSTPSFGVLRALPDWQERFVTFYLRPPHPALTQIDGLTEPFDPAHPPASYPQTMSTDDFQDLLTFASQVPPLDLGAPLQVD